MSVANLANRVNLKSATILLLEPNMQGMSILSQILAGFGAKHVIKAETIAVAKAIAEKEELDLIICEGQFDSDEDMDGYDFVHWLRRSALEPNAFCPAIIASAHTSMRNVARARDCGAHFFVVKPLAPGVLLDRIVWVAAENRSFVNCDVYVGPDRRFKNIGPPDGSDGRRSTDLKGAVGEPSMPNMSQNDIDSLMQPKRAAV